MTAFPKYPAYKDSGVEWLGDVPEHWNTEKGKWLFVLMERPPRKEDDIVTAFRDGQVTLRINRRTEGFTNAIKEHGYQGIRKGDLVIHAMDAFAGAIGVSDSDGKSTPVYSACVPRQQNSVNPFFYAYLLRHMAHSGFITTLAKGIRERSTNFSFTDFAGLRLPLPAKQEQDRIVAFLDEKTVEIDRLIVRKQRQIELLDEQKAILINRAVTRGLHPNPDLQDSGIPWIGPIPKGWEMKRLRHITTRIGDGLHGTPVYDDRSSVAFVNGNNLQKGKVVVTEETRMVSEKTLRGHFVAFGNNTLFLSINGTLGNAALYSGERLMLGKSVAFINCTNVLNAEFAMHVLTSAPYLLVFQRIATGSTILNLSLAALRSLPFALPPIEEQHVILQSIKTYEDQHVKASHAVASQIQTLQTLRSTLIAHAVTGKIQVS